MVHDRDVLTGGTRCDDVIFDNARVIQKDLTYFDEVQIQIVNQNALQIINLPISSDNFPVQTVITDMMGKVILNTTSHQKSFSIDNLPLRKGVYFVSLISGDNFKTFKILNYE